MIQALLVLADYVPINTYGPHIFIKLKKKKKEPSARQTVLTHG